MIFVLSNLIVVLCSEGVYDFQIHDVSAGDYPQVLHIENKYYSAALRVGVASPDSKIDTLQDEGIILGITLDNVRALINDLYHAMSLLSFPSDWGINW